MVLQSATQRAKLSQTTRANVAIHAKPPFAKWLREVGGGAKPTPVVVRPDNAHDLPPPAPCSPRSPKSSHVSPRMSPGMRDVVECFLMHVCSASQAVSLCPEFTCCKFVRFQSRTVAHSQPNDRDGATTNDTLRILCGNAEQIPTTPENNHLGSSKVNPRALKPKLHTQRGATLPRDTEQPSAQPYQWHGWSWTFSFATGPPLNKKVPAEVWR